MLAPGQPQTGNCSESREGERYSEAHRSSRFHSVTQELSRGRRDSPGCGGTGRKITAGWQHRVHGWGEVGEVPSSSCLCSHLLQRSLGLFIPVIVILVALSAASNPVDHSGLSRTCPAGPTPTVSVSPLLATCSDLVSWSLMLGSLLSALCSYSPQLWLPYRIHYTAFILRAVPCSGQLIQNLWG